MSEPNVTLLLKAWRQGEAGALERAVPMVEGELRRLARGYLRRERSGHTLQTSALVNEAYLRLVDQDQVDWQGRAHFLGVAAQMMRRILVDHARRRVAAKRGGPQQALPLEEALARPGRAGLPAEDWLAVNDALAKLEALDERQARIVELRVFGGLKNDEVAAATGISRSTVKREWEAARAWLRRELTRR